METIQIEVEGGAVPTFLITPDAPSRLPALFVVPSIFGPAPDLVARLTKLADLATIALPDPFWRAGGVGVVPYENHADAVGRLAGFDFVRCAADLDAALEFARQRCNGRVVGLGICFGGPFVVRAASEGKLDGVVTWHGSRMQDVLDGAENITCPLRLHFGEADPVTPPEVIEQIRAAFAEHPDIDLVVHPGAVHGFSHEGAAYDERACRAGLAATSELLERLAGA